MQIQGFNAFDTAPGSNRGLFKLTFWQRIEYFLKALAFKRRILNQPQPSFFIRKESWERLFAGENVLEKNNNFKHSDGKKRQYEVYGFVFCVAFTKDKLKKEFYEKYGEKDPDQPTKYDDKNMLKGGKAYLRVRTILREINQNASSQIINVEVETEAIAFTDLELALGNMGTTTDSLVFLQPGDPRITEINSDVIVNHPSGTPAPANNSGIPQTFKDRCGSFIEKEGHIFSKDRMKEILDKYPHSEGSKITLIWNEKQKVISFKIKVNPEYGTEIPCPQPNICN